MGHNIEKNKENPEKAKEKICGQLQDCTEPTATIANMQLRFPEEFRGLEPDSLEMLEAAAVSVYLKSSTEWMNEKSLSREWRWTWQASE